MTTHEHGRMAEHNPNKMKRRPRPARPGQRRRSMAMQLPLHVLSMLVLSVLFCISSISYAWMPTLLTTSIDTRHAKSRSLMQRWSDATLASTPFHDDSASNNNNPLAVSQESLNAMLSTASSQADDASQPKSQTRRKQKPPRSERKAMERQRKERQTRQPQQPKPKKDTAPFSLHSTAVSQLTAESTADDVLRAIKRAQKQHDHHDLRVIAKFLIEECDVGFAYGYRGSLLARLAVAALRWENHAVARRAIDIRRLLRTHNDTDALEILQDELALPLEVSGTKRSDPLIQTVISINSQSFPLRAVTHYVCYIFPTLIGDTSRFLGKSKQNQTSSSIALFYCIPSFL
jgi:hypothetical protein